MTTRLAAALVALALATPAAALAQVANTPPPPLPPAAPPPPPVAAAPAAAVDPDAALERVLRSGCHQGLTAVEELVGRPDATWADTVLRLCRDILRKPGMRSVSPSASSDADGSPNTPTAETIAARREASSQQEGRGRLVLWSSLYGIWLGIATDLLFDIDGERSLILPPLLGMGVGLGVSLAVTSGVPITSGQAWTIITGLDYGSFNGALWAGSFDLDSKAVVGTTVASSVAATTIAIAVADAKRPSAGTIELVRSSLLWGTVGGSLGLAAFASDSGVSEEAALRSIALTMDLSFLVGLALAKNVSLSRSRVLIIDAGAIGGTMTGLGLAWLSVSDPSGDRRFIAAGGLIGMLAGIGVAAYATRDLDEEEDDTHPGTAAVPPGVLALHPDGRWRLGAPGPMPVLDGTGHRIVGATLNALSGSF